MRFYIHTTPEGNHLRQTECPYSVTLFDNEMQPISATFDSDSDDFDCGFSLASNRFAMGHWHSSDLKILNLESAGHIASFPFRKIAPIAAFDQSGKRLLFKSGSSVLLLNIDTSESVQVKGVRALDRLVWLKKIDEVLVASQKKGELLRISLKTAEVSQVSLPINATFFDVKHSPKADILVLIDRRKGVHCIEPTGWKVIWSVSLKKVLGKDHMGVGQFCGNGSLFGCSVAATNHNYTLVLDAYSGELVGKLDSTRTGLPYRDTLVRNSSTAYNSYVFRTLNLATGEKGEASLDIKER